MSFAKRRYDPIPKKPQTVRGLTLTDEIVSHPLLGKFRRTHVYRIPPFGEHYLGEFSIGIGISNGQIREPREILEEIK